MQNFDHLRLDGQTLRIFASVCETQSVSRTAAIFSLNQSTISHTLDKMRAAVGDPLFVRSGRGISATEKALMILPRVQQIIADIEGLVTPEEYDVARDPRPVVIAIPTPALLTEMRVLHARILEVSPDAMLDIRRLVPRDGVEQMLVHEEAEVGIAIAGYRYPPTLSHCVYGRDTPVVFYDPKVRGPVSSMEEYAAARHGVVNFGGGLKSEVEKSLNKIGLDRKIALVGPTTSMLGDLMRGTDIIATMPRRLANSIYEGLAFAPPPCELPDITYDLIWHRRFENSGRNIWLRQLILSTRQAEEG